MHRPEVGGCPMWPKKRKEASGGQCGWNREGEIRGSGLVWRQMALKLCWSLL